MLITILSWIYIFFVSLIIGLAVNRLLSKLIPVPSKDSFGVTGYLVTGIVALTVYAETFSIFYKIGAVCHLIMLAGAGVAAFVFRKELCELLEFFWNRLVGESSPVSDRQRRLVVFALIVLGAAFFTSRGSFHTDTGIYHAQAIRLIEEYGVIKGLGNLQLHFAYNSSYLSLCAMFTMGFMLPEKLHLHTMTGFFMVVFCCYAVHGLLRVREHKRHGGDFARIAILLYGLTNMTGLQSPATDYGTMFMVLYILTAWISYAEEHEDETEDIAYYGYLAVLSIFTVSMKLSAALLVLLAILPFIRLVQRKMWKELSFFLIIGFVSFLPYLVRNVIISGWLFYPVAAIDLFDVVWKIPREYMEVDATQIKVWARCLFDVTRVDDGISTWFPVWWENRTHFEEMLMYSEIVGAALLVFNTVHRIKEKSLDLAWIVFQATVILNIFLWFFTAPFVRYGLAFLFLLPLCAVGDALSMISKKNLVAIALSALICINFFSWIDNYFTDCMVFVKQNVLSGYYIAPVPFDEGHMTPVEQDGCTFYIAGLDEVNSYYTFPGTCYEDMLYRSELIGSKIEDGLKPKSVE